MARDEHQSAGSDKRPLEKKKLREMEEEKISEGGNCRCEEVSKKTLPEMLKLMLSDLAFWKKAKGHK